MPRVADIGAVHLECAGADDTLGQSGAPSERSQPRSASGPDLEYGGNMFEQAWETARRYTGMSRRPARLDVSRVRLRRMVRRWASGFSVLGALLVPALPSRACPSCATGVEARSQVLGSDFVFQLTVALLPFAIIGCICLCVEAIDRVRSESRARRLVE